MRQLLGSLSRFCRISHPLCPTGSIWEGRGDAVLVAATWEGIPHPSQCCPRVDFRCGEGKAVLEPLLTSAWV